MTIATVPNIAALRAYSLGAPANDIFVEGYFQGADGGEGIFWYNSSDTTSLDNGGTIIVDSANRRWYRETGVGPGGPVTAAQFGAKGDGTTDDYVPLNAMMGWLVKQGGGVAVLQASKHYLVSSTIVIASGGIELRGSGASTWIVNGTTSAAAIQFGDGSATYGRCVVRDIVFSSAAASGENTGLFLYIQSNIILQNVRMFPYPAALYNGIVLTQCYQPFFDNLDIESCRNTGFTFQTSGNMKVANCYSNGNGEHGWYFDGSSGGTFVNCEAYGNGGFAWLLDDANTSVSNIQFFMTNCIGDTSGNHNWVINRCTEAFFTNCWGSTQQSRTSNPGAVGFYLSGSAVANVTFSNGGAFFNNASGVYVDNANGSRSNICFMGFTAGTSKPTNYGNGKAQSAAGFGFQSGATAVSIIGGGATGNTGGAIYNGIGSQLTVIALNGYP